MRALELIKMGWTQGSKARDMDGKSCLFSGLPPVAWCAYGALETAYPSWEGMKAALARVRDVLGSNAIMAWNDEPGRTQVEVVAVFEKAGV